MIKAYAKINWALFITGINDGYHMLNSVMETIDLYDEINIIIGQKSTTTNSGIKDDICLKSAELFLNKAEISDGVSIEINKNIPMQAGLGGGSSDAAAVLKELQKIYAHPLNENELFGIAESLGADVPFFLDGGRQLAKGKGEILTPLDHMHRYHLVISKPNGGISTKQAFEEYDKSPTNLAGNVNLLINGLATRNYETISENMQNSLEKVSIKLQPEIKEIKHKLMQMGAISTVMSGSGSAVIGLFKEKQSDLSLLKNYWAISTTTI